MKIYRSAGEIEARLTVEELTPQDMNQNAGSLLAVLWNLCYQVARIGDQLARDARGRRGDASL